MCYVDLTRDELLPLYMQNSNGLTIITNGGSQFYYGRKGQEIRSFDPFKVQVVRLKPSLYLTAGKVLLHQIHYD